MSEFVLKCCAHCGKEFSSDVSTKLYCCTNCNKAAWRKRNPEKVKSYRKEYDGNVPNRILTRVKSRAKRCKIPFNLTIEDIIVPDLCPVLGIPIYSVSGAGTNQYHSPSLDRIVPELGYVKGNVRVISQRANLLKSNATIEELEAVLDDARKNLLL